MKGSIGTRTQRKWLFYGLKGYTSKTMNMYRSILKASKNEVAAFRVKVLEYHKKYKMTATLEAFGISRATLYRWKKTLKESEGRATSLIPKSRAPKVPRQPETKQEVKAFIKQYREAHPGVGKETIKYALDDVCALNGLKTVSASTIGRRVKEMKKKGEFLECQKTLTVDARTGKLKQRGQAKKRKKLRRKGYAPQACGDLVQMDSITLFEQGLKRYLVTAVDVKGRFAFAYEYATLSSLSAKDFMQKLQSVCPFAVKHVQTDNGQEFEKHFDAYVNEEKLVHFYNYPRHPKSNAYVERFNRTLQEQYVNWHKDELGDVETFNHGLMEYLLWYNTERPHKGLKNIPPLKYYLETEVKNKKKSHMLWTLTNILLPSPSSATL